MPSSPLELLRSLDDPVHLETPAGFHHRREQDRFSALVTNLETAFRCPCPHEHGLAVQDASFLGAAFVPAEATLWGTPLHVRISNFGLAMYCPDRPGCWSDAEAADLLDPRDRSTLDGLLAAAGYPVVPEHVLWTTYDGPAPLNSLRPTWFERFFDYL